MKLPRVKHCSLLSMLLASLLPLLPTSAWSQQTRGEPIRVLDNSFHQSVSMAYFIDLLDLALKQSEQQFGPYQLVPVNVPHSQERVLKLIQRGEAVDVAHSMSSSDRESHLLPIRVPLLKGLMGKRALIIRTEDSDKFSAISDINVLKQLTACQGQTWPDTQILKGNGFTVAEVKDFDAMFTMLSIGRCDYFPRGLQEVFDDHEKYNEIHANLAIADDLLLSYPAPVYFFVSKQKPILAERIEQGLKQLQRTGQLMEFMRSTSLTAFLFPLSQWDKMRVVELENTALSNIPKNTTSWLPIGSASMLNPKIH